MSFIPYRNFHGEKSSSEMCEGGSKIAKVVKGDDIGFYVFRGI